MENFDTHEDKKSTKFRIPISKIAILAVSVIIVLIVVLATTLSIKKNKTLTYNKRVIGPGGGGMNYIPRINPNNRNNIIVSTDMGGAYVSHDRGKSWKLLNIVGGVHTIAFDPNQKDVCYFGASTLYVSSDGGLTAKLFFPKEEDVKCEWVQYENQRRNIGVKGSSNYPEASNVMGVEVNPNDSNNIATILTKGAQAMLYETKNNGETFENVANFPINNDDSFLSVDWDYGRNKWIIILTKTVYSYWNGQTDKLYEANDTESSIKEGVPQRDGHFLISLNSKNESL